MVISIFSFIVHGPFFGYWTGKHEFEMDKANGIQTKAVLSESFYSNGERMKYEFKVNEKYLNPLMSKTQIKIK